MSIEFDDLGLAIREPRGEVNWYAYRSLIVRASHGGGVVLGQRFRPRFRLDLSGAAAREFLARIPPAESRLSRLRRWAVRSPKQAALAILIPGYLLEHLPGSWIAPFTPIALVERLDGSLGDYVAANRCRSNEGQTVLNTLIQRLTPPNVAPPSAVAIRQSSFLVSARPGGQLLVDRGATAEVDAPVLAAVIAHELAHIEHGDISRAAGRGEGSRFVEHIVLGGNERWASLEFSGEEEARADREAIAILIKHRISLGPAAAFFARDEKARREDSYWAQNYSDVHPGAANRAKRWANAARHQQSTTLLMNERDSDALFNVCWDRPEGVRRKWP